MAGLGMEARRDGKGLTHLNREEALHALRFSFSELNGFPSWLEPLYRVFPEEALALIWGETRWELNESQADRPLHYMMHDLVYHAPWLHKDLAPHIHDWFVDHSAPNDDCLRYGRIIMSGGGLPGTKLARLAKRRVEDPKTPESQLATWYAMWASLAPDDAIPALKIRLGALSRPDDAGFAERFIVALMGERAASGPSGSAWKTPEHLRTLYVLMHEHIRTSEDVKRPHGEVFERRKRDSAEDARSNLFGLLASIPGEESYRQILALANIHPDVGYRSHMRARAYQRAVTDSDRDWSVEDVVALD